MRTTHRLNVPETTHIVLKRGRRWRLARAGAPDKRVCLREGAEGGLPAHSFWLSRTRGRQGSAAACDAAGEIARLPSPWAPWKGAPLRVMLVTEKPLQGELSLTGSPMDFSAWFEAFVGGRWHTFDARHNIPRIGRILIARGRDAADVAISTTF